MPPRDDTKTEPSVLECYISIGLANDFRKHFAREPGYSRPHEGGAISGPFVRFAIAVCMEAGIHVSAETVAQYLKRARQRDMGTKPG